jgi:hypothetical protein
MTASTVFVILMAMFVRAWPAGLLRDHHGVVIYDGDPHNREAGCSSPEQHGERLQLPTT